MAVLVLNGGYPLRVPGTADAAVDDLQTDAGLIPLAWHEIESGGHRVRVNPHSIAYIIDDEAWDSSFGPVSQR